jgi:hypothetical protein
LTGTEQPDAVVPYANTYHITIKGNDVMKKIRITICTLFVLVVSGCATIEPEQVKLIQPVNSSNYKGYRAIDPLPVSKVTKYDAVSSSEIEVFWASISDKKEKRSLLPIQSSQVSVTKTDTSGSASYLTASVSGEAGNYTVVMDYMKYRVEQVFDTSATFIGNGRVGVGLRIKANVQTTKSSLNLGSIIGLGLEAERGNLSGGISVDVIGIDSEGVTNLIPMTSEIDQTAIQSALQALASVKAKLWEDDVSITPHLVAITEALESSESKIRAIASKPSSLSQ